MLLKFSSPDMLNSKLLEATTGECVYTLSTTKIESHTPSPSCSEETNESSWEQPATSSRLTTLQDVQGRSLASILWTGRRPKFVIGDEDIGHFPELFDISGAKILPNELLIPSRFDPGHVWKATPSSLTLVNSETQSVKATYHHNAIRLPKAPLTLLRTLPGMGNNYLEMPSESLSAVEPAEIIVSFLIVEIIRRGCFSLLPYMFERSKFWALEEMRYMVTRRWRRNTV